MTISSSVNKAGPYLTNGSVDDFSFPYPVFESGDLVVYLRNISTGAQSTLTEGAGNDYTVALINDGADGATVTTTSVYDSGYSITILRSVDLDQDTDLSNTTRLLPQVIEDRMDLDVMGLQQLQEQLDRSVKIDATSTRDVDDLLTALETLADGGASVYSSEYLLSTYNGDLAAAVLALAGAEANLVIDRDATLAASLTIPATINLRFVKGNVVTLGAYNLTVNGNITAGPWQIFDISSTGVVNGVPSIIEVYPQWFGAKGDGSTDDTAAFQAIFNWAKGADETAVGRANFEVRIPTPLVYYKITDTLVIDGTHGLVVRGDRGMYRRYNYPASNLTQCLVWHGTSSAPVIQIMGQTSGTSNPNFNITLENLTISGYSAVLDPTAAMPATAALAGVFIGSLDGTSEATLARMVELKNLMVANARFGIYSGNPDSQNTDHANLSIHSCYLENNAQAGLHIGTGNCVANAYDIVCSGNGWGAPAADDYCEQKGANVMAYAGYLNLFGYTSAGLGDSKPADADIYESLGRVAVTNAWSDTHGYFFYQVGGGSIYPTQLTGVRHYEGTMDATNTPDSLLLVNPGMVVSGSAVYGNIRINSGQSGRPVCMGVRFIRSGATYIGTGIDTQRSLIAIGTEGNSAQQIFGGRDTGVALTHSGSLVPQTLSLGTSLSGYGWLNAIRQILGAGATDSGMTEVFNASGGTYALLINCYFNGTNFTPMQTDAPCWLIEFGGNTRGISVQVYDPSGSAAAFASFTECGVFRSGVGNGYRDEVVFVPPLRAAAPTFSSGDYWEGGIYYNTTTNKLQVNTGSTTWVDLH